MLPNTPRGAPFKGADVVALAPPVFSVGDRVGGWTVMQKLESSPMHEVLAADAAGACVVLRVPPDTGAAKRVRAEADLAQWHLHGAIIQSVGVVDVRGWPVQVLEQVDGLTLDALSLMGGPLPPEGVCRIARQLASAVADLHTKPPVAFHGALSAERVLIDADGNARLRDLGRVRPEQSLRHLSPERREDLSPPSAADDLYALGIVVVEAALGQPVEIGEGYLDTRVLEGVLPSRLCDAVGVLLAPADGRLSNAAAAVRIFSELERQFAQGDGETDGRHALTVALEKARIGRIVDDPEATLDNVDSGRHITVPDGLQAVPIAEKPEDAVTETLLARKPSKSLDKPRQRSQPSQPSVAPAPEDTAPISPPDAQAQLAQPQAAPVGDDAGYVIQSGSKKRPAQMKRRSSPRNVAVFASLVFFWISVAMIMNRWFEMQVGAALGGLGLASASASAGNDPFAAFGANSAFGSDDAKLSDDEAKAAAALAGLFGEALKEGAKAQAADGTKLSKEEEEAAAALAGLFGKALEESAKAPPADTKLTKEEEEAAAALANLFGEALKEGAKAEAAAAAAPPPSDAKLSDDEAKAAQAIGDLFAAALTAPAPAAAPASASPGKAPAFGEERGGRRRGKPGAKPLTPVTRYNEPTPNAADAKALAELEAGLQAMAASSAPPAKPAVDAMPAGDADAARPSFSTTATTKRGAKPAPVIAKAAPAPAKAAPARAPNLLPRKAPAPAAAAPAPALDDDEPAPLGPPVKLVLGGVASSVASRAAQSLRSCEIMEHTVGVVTFAGGKAKKVTTDPKNACVEKQLRRTLVGAGVTSEGAEPFEVIP